MYCRDLWFLEQGRAESLRPLSEGLITAEQNKKIVKQFGIPTNKMYQPVEYLGHGLVCDLYICTSTLKEAHAHVAVIICCSKGYISGAFCAEIGAENMNNYQKPTHIFLSS
jgi:hypothetical protein